MMGNIVQGPWAVSMKRGKSARAIEIERIERDFLKLRRRDEDVFKRLAVKMHGYLTEVEAKGGKSGAIGWIIGGDTDGTARHRKRFSWDGDPSRDFKKDSLAKNPREWLAVLRRCADALPRPFDELMLDAFSGSRIRPSAAPTDFAQASWMQSFLDLMMLLEDRLCGQREVIGLLDYIADALLEFDGGNLVEANDAMLPSFRADIPDWPEMLDQLPFVQTCYNEIGGYSYRPHPSMDPGKAEAWSKVIEGCQVMHLAETHHLSLIMAVLRGLAIIPGEGAGRPRLSLYKYPRAKLCVSDLGVDFDKNSRIIDLPPYLHPAAGEILFPLYPDYPPHLVERVSFAPLGSESFKLLAAESLAKYESFLQHLELDGGGCWDPMYTDEGKNMRWASSAPKATVAATIERNLLFADEAGAPNQRLDRLLQAELNRMVNAVHQERVRVDQIVAPARRNLLAEWSESPPQRKAKAGD